MDARLGPANPINDYNVRFPSQDGGKALAALADGGWLKPGALAVLEERAGTAVAIPDALTLLDTRTWGDTDVRFLRVQT